MLIVNVVGSGGIGISVWLLGQHYGPLGAAWGYLAIVALVLAPGYQWIYWNCRRERPQSHLSSSADVPRV
jgi:O-antigen/teichoic acid export membrane protein